MVKEKLLTAVSVIAAVVLALSCNKELKHPGDLSGRSLFGTDIGRGKYFLLVFDSNPSRCTLSKYIDTLHWRVRGTRIDTAGKKVYTVPGECIRYDEFNCAFSFHGIDDSVATMRYSDGVYYFMIDGEFYHMPED